MNYTWFGFLLGTLGIIFLGLFGIRMFLVVIVVRGLSMCPTLRHGDRVLVVRHWPEYWLRIGQLVVGRIPTETGNITTKNAQTQQLYVKRVIGLPGDVVRLNTLANKKKSSNAHTKHDNSVPCTWYIPPGSCFVKGDAETSTDSVTWGPIAFDSLIGVVLFKLPRRANISNLQYHPNLSQDSFDVQVIESRIQE